MANPIRLTSTAGAIDASIASVVGDDAHLAGPTKLSLVVGGNGELMLVAAKPASAPLGVAFVLAPEAATALGELIAKTITEQAAASLAASKG